MDSNLISIYIKSLKQIRDDLIVKTIPSIRSNPNALAVTTKWLEFMNADIDMHEAMFLRIKQLESQIKE